MTAEGTPLRASEPDGRCTATTKRGTRCSRGAEAGTDKCFQHADDATPRTKLTDEIANEIVKVLRLGGFVEQAAQIAGISKMTLYNWLERGDPERADAPPADEPFRRLRERVEKARAEAIQDAAARVLRASQSDWRAAAWYLERIDPERWALRGRSTSHSDSVGAVVHARPGAPHLRLVDDQVHADGSPL